MTGRHVPAWHPEHEPGDDDPAAQPAPADMGPSVAVWWAAGCATAVLSWLLVVAVVWAVWVR